METVEDWTPLPGGRQRDWSALGDLPLSIVARRLSTLLDFFRFRGICASWRSVGISVEEEVMDSHSPLFLTKNLDRLYHPIERRYYKRLGGDLVVPLVRSSYRRVVASEEMPTRFALAVAPIPMDYTAFSSGFIPNSGTGAVRAMFPRPGNRPMMQMQAPPALVVNHSHGHLILIANNRPWLKNLMTGAEYHSFPRARLSFSHALLTCAPTSPGCVLVAFDACCIQFCRLGDKKWCVMYSAGSRRTPPMANDLVALVNGLAIVGTKVYAVLLGRGIASFDLIGSDGRPSTLSINHVVWPSTDKPENPTWMWFGESRGELHAITVSSWNMYSEFHVFRLDLSEKVWVKLEDLDGRSAFVDANGGFLMVDSRDGRRWKKNRIYYFDTWLQDVSGRIMKGGKSLPSGPSSLHLPPYAHPDVQRESAGLWVLPSGLCSGRSNIC